MSLQTILEKYRSESTSEFDKGSRFEKLMKAYLQTDPKYAYILQDVWLWDEFPFKNDFGGHDIGIDLVAKTTDGEYWAIQCKFYLETTTINKDSVDSFLSISSRQFRDENKKQQKFSQCLWISTSNKWGTHAASTIENRVIPFFRLSLHDLEESSVDWLQLDKGIYGEAARIKRKSLRPHQTEAVEKAHQYFQKEQRGKLIMACGTGKTFTALRIAERETQGQGRLVLFLVPSIALMGQTLREWTANSQEPLQSICVCSDPKIVEDTSKKKGKKKVEEAQDPDMYGTVDLALPASTDVHTIKQRLVNALEHNALEHSTGLTVVFSTYQSIDAVAEAQRLMMEEHGKGEFDIVICDEAHRTTGVQLAGEDPSAFIKIHNNDFIRAKKRLYMTATPRLYGEEAQTKAQISEAVLCSMDDEKLYGHEIYRIGFGEAVEKDLLTDYKVLVLTLNEHDVPPAIQRMIEDANSEINTDNASKFIGCINALSKQVLGDAGVLKEHDPEPMRRAVAFCQDIKTSKQTTNVFNAAGNEYVRSLSPELQQTIVSASSKHIDGTMSAPERDELLTWLKADISGNETRLLTNVRCLSEGVDVPSLDAVIFLSPRNSQIDVVQSVGRVMRKAEGKKYGYIIIPIIINSQEKPEEALNNNERYAVVWSVLNALRAHDDRFNATINQIDLNKKRPPQILVGRPTTTFKGGESNVAETTAAETTSKKLSEQMMLQFEGLQNVIFAKMVQKVGSRTYWENWAKDVGAIATREVARLNKLIDESEAHTTAFDAFVEGLQKTVNPSITRQDAVDMLSQHIITKPVFEAIFEGYSFVKNNPVSVAMQGILDTLDDQTSAIEKDTETLKKFYDSVKRRAAGIDNAEAKQRIILELYDKFFKAAFPKMVQQLGIVYTPVEIVDFIIHSVDDVLKQEFSRGLTDDNVHILDPFTGTGTFITRLLQSGLIKQEDLLRKYKKEIHANEIVLLAYYIAAVNIENVFHDMAEKKEYQPFEGIVLTDTFQLGENEEDEKMFLDMFAQNSERSIHQKKVPLKVIIGNPPYSIGQKSANDNAKNQAYPKLDAEIRKKYTETSNAVLNRSSYDLYVKAFMWSSNRIDPKEGGIICFVTNGSWIDNNGSDGMRKQLEKEFSSIYVFNLRGNSIPSGKLRQMEGENVFSDQSKSPIVVTLLVKKPNEQSTKAKIYYHDIGDYLKREQKLEIVKRFGSVFNEQMQWQQINPNEHGDWLQQRNEDFSTFIPLISETRANSFFSKNFVGIVTSRDSWVYNFSKANLENNTKRMADFYNDQVELFTQAKKQNANIDVNKFVSSDKTKISWSRSLKKNVSRQIQHQWTDTAIQQSIYRPFTKQNLYFDKLFIESPGFNHQIFPTSEVINLAICIQGLGGKKDFSCIISNIIVDFNSLEAGSQCFPLYYFEKREKSNSLLFESHNEEEYIRRDGITDFILKEAHEKYQDTTITKEDIFYYVYGFLHHPEYRTTFANNLKKELPRIILVESLEDFWAFSKAGRQLGDLHINYESVPAPEGVVVVGAEKGNFTVEKMKNPKKGQKDVILYNKTIKIENIPEKAYQYVVNGRSAIEWVIERYQVKTDKDSGITNNPNDWALEHEKPRYILDLLLSVINLSVQTVDIVESLPKVKFEY